MRYLAWLLRVAVFLGIFAFALNNLAQVRVHFFFGHWADLPLVVLLLLALGLGLVMGLAMMLPYWWRARRLPPSSPASLETDSTHASPDAERSPHGT